MGKTAYLIVTDLHLGNIAVASRIDYRNEVMDVKIKLTQIAVRYRNAGYEVVTLFLGDIFHTGYRDVTTAVVDLGFVAMWSSKIGKIYSVVGNHELTYYKANPFYATIAEVESQKVRSIMNKVWTPLGAMTTINVVDCLKDGNTYFYFNHYGTPITTPDSGGVNIGLFHQDVIDHQIKQEMERSDRKLGFVQSTDLEESRLLSGYNYCFFGHMHTVYGAWKANNTYLVYLASLGRTNSTEVRNDFLERNVPAVVVEDGVFQTVEDNFIQLMAREECVVEDVVTQLAVNAHVMTEKKELRNYVPLYDDPMDNLNTVFAENPAVLRIIQDLAYDSVDSRYRELRRKMDSLL